MPIAHGAPVAVVAAAEPQRRPDVVVTGRMPTASTATTPASASAIDAERIDRIAREVLYSAPGWSG